MSEWHDPRQLRFLCKQPQTRAMSYLWFRLHRRPAVSPVDPDAAVAVVTVRASEAPGRDVPLALPATRRLSTFLTAIGVQHGEPWHRRASVLRAIVTLSFSVRFFAFVAANPDHPARMLAVASGVVELATALWRAHFAALPSGRWFDVLLGGAVKSLPDAERDIERAAYVLLPAVVVMSIAVAAVLLSGTFSALAPEMAAAYQYPWGQVVNACVLPVMLLDVPVMLMSPAAFALVCLRLIAQFDRILAERTPSSEAVAGFRRAYTAALDSVGSADETLGPWMRTSVVVLVLLLIAMLQAILFGAKTSVAMTVLGARGCGSWWALGNKNNGCFCGAAHFRISSLLRV